MANHDDLELTVTDVKEKMQSSLESLYNAMSMVRSNRASTALVDDIKVDVYGQAMPLNQVANVNIPEARLITIDVWDKGNIQDVEKAIMKSGRNLNPQNDGSLIRINLPELTEESRKEMVKVAKQKVEDHKVSIRNIRRDGNDDIKNMKGDGVSEDEVHTYQEKVQKLTDSYIKDMDDVFTKKKRDHDGLTRVARPPHLPPGEDRISLDSLRKKLNKRRMPRHIAVIMDGNGRWAKERSLSRIEGHREGARVLDRLMDVLLDLKVPVISLFAFSTENWSRPRTEVRALFDLLDIFITDKLETMQKNGIKFIVSGEISRLPARSRKLIEEGMKATAGNKRLTANFCLNYGARDEILRAMGKMLEKRLQSLQRRKKVPTLKDLEKLVRKPASRELESNLYTHGIPDVDLVIRTSGEKRLSNFLLYQCAYAEFYFTPVYWPDFDEYEMVKSLVEYQQRDRRYGGV